MNNPFDRCIVNPREKPLSQDINRPQSQSDYAHRFMAEHGLGARTSASSFGLAQQSGFRPYSFVVEQTSPASMDVTVKRGVGFYDDAADCPSAINGVIGLDDLSRYKPLVLMNDVTFTVPTAPGLGDSRIDIIEVRANRQVTDSTSRLILDPTTGAFAPDMVNKTLAFAVDGSAGYVISPALSTVALSYKQGAASATGTEVEPSVTPGYIQVARINVGPSVTTIARTEIADKRRILAPAGVLPFSGTWRIEYNGGAPIETCRYLSAPPGIQLGVRAFGSALEKLKLSLYICGGEISQVDAVGSFSSRSMTVPEAAFIAAQRWGQGIVVQLQDVSSAIHALLPATTPLVETGVGAKIYQGTWWGVFDDGTPSLTDAKLEDVDFHVSGTISYF
jgi:hypothetical protein